MASIGHVAIGLAARKFYEGDIVPRWPPLAGMFLWSGLSLLPDADVAGFSFGIPYSSQFGHRGATHSIAFAVAVGVAAYVIAVAKALPRMRTALLVTLVVASHSLLDTLTDGGRGCALLWPFSTERFFAPWRPLPVAPIGLQFFTMSGLHVAAAEMLWFSIPFLYALWPNRLSHRHSTAS
jgi:inner membrane protein